MKNNGPAIMNKQAYLHMHDENCSGSFNLYLTDVSNSSCVGPDGRDIEQLKIHRSHDIQRWS